MNIFKNKKLLITGGTGSFGNAILRRFLSTDIKNWLQKSRLNFESHILNASPMIKILATLSRLPLLRRFNTADKAQQKATENVRRLLDLHTTR